MKMKYTEQAVETLDDAGSVIANKNIEIEQLRQRVQELEKERDEYHQVAMQTSEDSKRLDFLDQTAAEYILSVGRLWYSRKGYNQPYIKRENLRDAIDHGILAKGYKK